MMSLIIATRDRPEQLDHLLSSLSQQTYINFEVIIIDQGVFTPVHELCTQYSHPLTIKYYSQGGTGLSRARNYGLQKASSEIIGFPDDDCWYSPETLSSVSQVMQAHPHAGFISGQYSEPGSTGRFPDRAQKISLWNVFRCISSITLFFRAEAIQGMSFNEQLGAGSTLPASEEIDFVIRLLEKGINGFYTPDVRIFHPVIRPSILDLNQQKAFGFMLANLIRTMHGTWRIKMLFRTILLMTKSVALAVFKPGEFQRLSYRLDGMKLAFNKKFPSATP